MVSFMIEGGREGGIVSISFGIGDGCRLVKDQI